MIGSLNQVPRIANAIAASAALIAAPASAQHILELPGKTVEVIGLRQWSIQMLQDSLARYAPKERLDSHGCAAALRYKLGFPEAAVFYYGQWPGDSLERLVVMVVEPTDSGRVRHKPAPIDSTAPRPEWKEAIDLLTSSPGVAQIAARHYPAWRSAPESVQLPAWAKRDSLQVEAYWRFLHTHSSENDYRAARDALESDPDYRNRMVAATMLSAFMERDEAIHALIDALREEEGHVRMWAATMLTGIAQERRQPVNWAPAVPAIHALLNGTSLFTLPTVLRVLVSLNADPRYASSFLKGGGEAVLDNLSAQHPEHRNAAHKLLVQLRGADLGTDVTVWRAWIASL